MNARFDEFDYAQSNIIVKHYVCAQCWGPLMQDFNPGKPKERRYKVTCPDCGEDRGFVTREFAEQRKAESGAKAREAAHNLGELLGIEKKHSTKDAIKALYP